MPIELSGLLHNYQPFRDLWEVTYIPPNVRYSSHIAPRRLIPYPDHAPAPDWNLTEVTPECYKVCAKGDVYSYLPFNFGPSLLKDLWINARSVYDKIVESEKESSDRFQGHSNSLAQASPSHSILPLVKDLRESHIEWGIDEYKNHFKKDPEGMWLPETAVDYDTLALLAESGIKYVILAPKQAKAVRRINTGDWQDTGWEGRNIDPSKPYKVYFEKGEHSDKNISVFFYDGGFSLDLGFPSGVSRWLYDSSENFLHRWLGARGDFKHFAVDGETFGHHHKGKAQLLVGAIGLINSRPGDWQNAKFVNYGLYLEKNPPEHEVKIYENTAWSCNHGLVRWGEERDIPCDCTKDHHEWSIPMKKAFDDLAERIDYIYFRYAQKYLKEPLNALIEYGKVTSCSESFYEWFLKHGKEGLSHKEIEEAYMLLEMEKFKTYMFTSCGWFHSSPGGIETFTNFICANTAIRIAKFFKPNSTIEEGFKAMLSKEPKFKDDFLRAYSQADELNKKLLNEANPAIFLHAA